MAAALLQLLEVQPRGPSQEGRRPLCASVALVGSNWAVLHCDLLGAAVMDDPAAHSMKRSKAGWAPPCKHNLG